MLEKLVSFAVFVLGWLACARPEVIAEQCWYARLNVANGHPLKVVFGKACVAFRRKA